MTTVLEISSQSFQSEVIDSSTPVSVYFWAPWYSPCHKNMPLLEDMSRKLKDKIVFVKLNIDQNDTLAVYPSD